MRNKDKDQVEVLRADHFVQDFGGMIEVSVLSVIESRGVQEPNFEQRWRGGDFRRFHLHEETLAQMEKIVVVLLGCISGCKIVEVDGDSRLLVAYLIGGKVGFDNER